MSLFLGKIHYWLFNKILWFEKLENEIINLAKEENLNSEDLLISEIMTLCPKKIEILDKSNSKKSRETIEIVSLLFEGKVTVIYSN